MALTLYVSKPMIYQEVHQLSRNGFSIRYISNHLNLNWRTVKRLLDIKNDREYEQYLSAVSDKQRLLEPYENFVKSRLELYRDTSAAQMHEPYDFVPNTGNLLAALLEADFRTRVENIADWSLHWPD